MRSSPPGPTTRPPSPASTSSRGRTGPAAEGEPGRVDRAARGLTELGLTDRADKLVFVGGLVGRESTSSSELSTREAAEAIDAVRAQLADGEESVPGAPGDA